MFICSMLIFGTIGIFRRFIPLPSASLACVRGILGGLFLLAFVRIRGQGMPLRIPSRSFLLLVLTGALIGINWILLFEAYNYTTVAVATLCYYMQPTITILLATLLFREKLTARKAVCAALSVLGMVLVSGVIGDRTGNAGHFRGILLGLGAACFYACVVILNKKIRDVSAYPRTIVQLLSAGLVMIPYLWMTGGFGGTGMGPAEILLLLVVGIVHTGIAYALYFGGMEGLSVQSVATLSYIDPVSALLFSAVLLHEPLSPLNLIGAVMIIGAAMANEMQPPRRKRDKDTGRLN
ncbi:MAG: EamA family transporter [Clostridia bacterium]|nr:EamA family transporter [Clostridia bacterium]